MRDSVAAVTQRRLWQIVRWLASVASVVIVVSVLRGAGVPVSLPGVLVVVAVLFVVRLAVGRARRRRARSRQEGRG